MSEDDVPIALVFVMFAAFACVVPPQADTFYHLRSGRAMWESGWFLDRELFSSTSYGQPLYNHWWLSQIAFFALHALGGPVLLTLATGACGFLALVMSFRLIRGGMEVRLVLLLSLILILPQWSLRPQVFSMVLLMLTLQLVLAGRFLWMLAVLLVWANAHAMVIFGIATAGIAAVEAVIWSRGRARAAVAAAAAAVLVPMASPLGVHYWPRVLETVRLSRLLGIHEYRPAVAAGADALGFWVMLAALIVVSARAIGTLRDRDPADRVLLLTAGLLGAAALLSFRNASFFALVAAPAISRLLPPTTARSRPARPAARALLGLAAGLALGFVVYKWRDDGAHLGWHPMTPAAIAAVRECPAPMFNEFGAGGILMWFVPEQPVFVDGRVEAYPAEFLRRSQRADVSADYRALFEDYRIRCAVVMNGAPMATALRQDASVTPWFEDRTWVVFVRPTHQP